VFGLQQGNAVLKEIHKEMSIESVEKLMGETADAIAYQNEIDEVMSQRITADDEDEVQRELEQLEAEQIGLTLPKAPSAELSIPIPGEQRDTIETETRSHIKTPTKGREPARQAIAA